MKKEYQFKKGMYLSKAAADTTRALGALFDLKPDKHEVDLPDGKRATGTRYLILTKDQATPVGTLTTQRNPDGAGGTLTLEGTHAQMATIAPIVEAAAIENDVKPDPAGRVK